ncbi:Mov34/MPN/PAD-1 family protein [Streptomyces sp. NPDC008137]|uniref:Mov34/MPN/PAD-1 family protein n=1 Tax=Streptomyces sp. NPDC008137 TaxID=3364813 RepID=UPI0036E41C28
MTDADEDFSISPVPRISLKDTPASITELPLGADGFRLEVADHVLSGMRGHAALDTEQECGGVLLGRHYCSDDRYAVRITDSLAVPTESRSQVHFDFDATSMDAIFTRLGDGAEEYVVGWYHSHIAGAPFMSGIDRRTHRRHFTEPWYVSCVVGAGEWGVPVGFWRWVDDRLRAVDDYCVTTRAVPPQAVLENHRRYLRACGMPEDSAETSVLRALSLFPALGIDPRGPLGQVLLPPKEPSGGRRWLLGSGSQLQLIVGLASAAAGEPSAAAELALLRERLLMTRPLQDVLHRALFNGDFTDLLAVHRGVCCALEPDGEMVRRYDIANGGAIHVTLGVRLDTLSFGPEGDLFLTSDDQRLYKLPPTVKQEGSAYQYEFHTMLLTGLDGTCRQLLAAEDELWMLTDDDRWLRYPYPRRIEAISPLGSGRLPPADCHFVLEEPVSESPSSRSSLSSVFLLTADSGSLGTWRWEAGTWAEQCTSKLPAPFRDASVVQACVGGPGIYVLFEDRTRHQLALFERGSLKLLCHFLDLETSEPVNPTGMCADRIGRVYIRTEDELYRIRV